MLNENNDSILRYIIYNDKLYVYLMMNYSTRDAKLEIIKYPILK